MHGVKTFTRSAETGPTEESALPRQDSWNGSAVPPANAADKFRTKRNHLNIVRAGKEEEVQVKGEAIKSLLYQYL